MWLDLFTDKKVEVKNAPGQILQKILEEKWSLSKGDRDMIVMQHQFIYNLNGKCNKLKSSLVVYGDNQKHTSMGLKLLVYLVAVHCKTYFKWRD